MAGNTPRNDPLTTFLFGLQLTDLGMDHQQGTAFFKSCTGLSAQVDTMPYTEGGVTAFTRVVMNTMKWSNIVLSQGFTGDMNLFSWITTPFRTDGTIVALGPGMKPVASWQFTKGYPVNWKGPDLDATKNEIAIETIEIAHEGLTMKIHK
jgi:phage tail-like protein